MSVVERDNAERGGGRGEERKRTISKRLWAFVQWFRCTLGAKLKRLFELIKVNSLCGQHCLKGGGGGMEEKKQCQVGWS